MGPPYVQRPAVRRSSRPAPAMGGGILVLSAVTLLAVLGIVVVFVVLPVVVKARCVSTAEEQGITLRRSTT